MTNVQASENASGKRRPINLALQGGGAHGAFTWGVLDRLLEDDTFEIDGISGTSAGAINGAALAAGYAENGRAGARQKLDELWEEIGAMGRFSPLQATAVDRLLGSWRIDHTPAYKLFDIMTRLFAPRDLNPMNIHPIATVLDRVIDFDMLRYASGIKFFVAATNVRSGKVKVFSNREVDCRVLLASSCLPQLYQPIEIDGEYFYDGGYMGNPCIFPLIYECDARDVVIVQINPLYRDEIPQTAREILDRVNEISFNSSLMREMRAIHFVERLIDSGQLDPTLYKRMLIHMIEDAEGMRPLGAATKVNADPAFLAHLKSLGRRAADRWLEAKAGAVGSRSTLDLVETFM